MFYAQLALFPYWFQSKSRQFADIFWALFGELPIVIIAFWLVEVRSLGRKKLLTIFSALEALTSLGIFLLFWFDLGSEFLFGVNRLFMKGIFSIIYVYTPEVYPTHIRVNGYAFASAFGRFGSFVMPFVCFPLFYVQKYLPILTFTFMGVVSTFASNSLPFDTLERDLDVPDEGFEMEEMNEPLVRNRDSKVNSVAYLSMHDESFEIEFN